MGYSNKLNCEKSHILYAFQITDFAVVAYSAVACISMVYEEQHSVCNECLLFWLTAESPNGFYGLYTGLAGSAAQTLSQHCQKQTGY